MAIKFDKIPSMLLVEIFSGFKFNELPSVMLVSRGMQEQVIKATVFKTSTMIKNFTSILNEKLKEKQIKQVRTFNLNYIKSLKRLKIDVIVIQQELMNMISLLDVEDINNLASQLITPPLLMEDIFELCAKKGKTEELPGFVKTIRKLTQLGDFDTAITVANKMLSDPLGRKGIFYQIINDSRKAGQIHQVIETASTISCRYLIASPKFPFKTLREINLPPHLSEMIPCLFEILLFNDNDFKRAIQIGKMLDQYDFNKEKEDILLDFFFRLIVKIEGRFLGRPNRNPLPIIDDIEKGIEAVKMVSDGQRKSEVLSWAIERSLKIGKFNQAIKVAKELPHGSVEQRENCLKIVQALSQASKTDRAARVAIEMIPANTEERLKALGCIAKALIGTNSRIKSRIT